MSFGAGRAVFRSSRFGALLVAALTFGSIFDAVAHATPSEAARSQDCAPAYQDPRRPARICILRSDKKAERAARDADICRAIEFYARRDGLPVGFFARLIWRESLFDPNAVSPAGAQGVAQFMPGTARLRGLDDSFNPAAALSASSAYLRVLQLRFGNLGLAAAAYNAGEAAIGGYLAKRRGAPAETRAYVRAITGFSIEDWRDGAPKADVDYALEGSEDGATAFHASCVALAATRRIEPMARGGDWAPWGALIAAHRSHGVAMRMYERAAAKHPELLGAAPLVLQRRIPGRGRRALFAAMIGRDSRAEAVRLCQRLAAAGAPCLVVKN